MSRAQARIPASSAGPRPSRASTLEDRAIARVLAPWLDRELAGGTGVSLSAAHAARVGQLTKAPTRRALARSLDRLVERAGDRRSRFSNWTIQPCAEQVRDAMPLILSTASRLRSDEPLSPLGIARLKTLLRDVSGPCYVPSWPGALTVALQDVSNALDIEAGGRRSPGRA